MNLKHPIQSNKIVMYTTSWCPDCIRAKKLLNEQKIEFIEIDIDQDKEAKAFFKT